MDIKSTGNRKNSLSYMVHGPSKQIRTLRELTRLRQKYVQQRASDHNRLINCLTVNNYKLDMVFSNVRGISASRIIDLILSFFYLFRQFIYMVPDDLQFLSLEFIEFESVAHQGGQAP